VTNVNTAKRFYIRQNNTMRQAAREAMMKGMQRIGTPKVGCVEVGPFGVQIGVRRRGVSRTPAWNKGSFTPQGSLDKHEVPGSNPGWPTNDGDVAQLVERRVCNADVRSSSLLVSIRKLGALSLAEFCA